MYDLLLQLHLSAEYVLLNGHLREAAINLIEDGVHLLILQEEMFHIEDALGQLLYLPQGFLYLFSVGDGTFVDIFHQFLYVLPDLHLESEIANFRVLSY